MREKIRGLVGKVWHNEFWRATALFALLGFVVVPLLLRLAQGVWGVAYEIHYFSFTGYCVVVLIGFLIHNRKKFSKAKVGGGLWERVLFLTLSVVSFAVYLWVLSMDISIMEASILITVAGIFYVLGIFFLALVLYGFAFFWKYEIDVITVVVLVALYYATTKILWLMWDVLSRAVGYLSFRLMSFFTQNVSYEQTATTPLLRLHNFSVAIGEPCSGVESLSLFLGLFLLLLIYEAENISLRRAFVVFAVGVPLVFLLNVVRVSLIMVMGQFNGEFALGAFHSQIGWVLFSILILLMLYFTYPWMRGKSRGTKKR